MSQLATAPSSTQQQNAENGHGRLMSNSLSSQQLQQTRIILHSRSAAEKNQPWATFSSILYVFHRSVNAAADVDYSSTVGSQFNSKNGYVTRDNSDRLPNINLSELAVICDICVWGSRFDKVVGEETLTLRKLVSSG